MRLDGEAWRTFFDSYQREAFRLETLPAYNVGSERAEYERFLATGRLDISDGDPWLTRVRHFRRTGRWIGRVHVISRPLTDYLRYEFAVYHYTVTAGEDVRILNLTDQPNPGLPAQDFWLMDIFAPTQAVWHYMGALEHAVTALLRLPPPHHPDAPITAYSAPLTLFVSTREQRPMTIRIGCQKSVTCPDVDIHVRH